MSNFPGSRSQFWVTYVADDSDLLNSLVLAESILRTFTTCRVLALIGPLVTKDGREQLASRFNEILSLPFPLLWTKAPKIIAYFAKMYCFALPGIHQVIFLPSKSIVLNNIDELFLECATTVQYSGFGTVKKNKLSLMDSVLWIPHYPTVFEHFMEILDSYYSKFDCHLGSDKLHDEIIHLQDIFVAKHVTFVDPPLDYILEIDMCCKASKGSKSILTPRIIHFPHKTPADYIQTEISKNNWFESGVVKYWNDIFTEISKKHRPINFPNLCLVLAYKEPIAIIGMACRLPCANTVDEYWQLLLRKGDAISSVPKNRWNNDVESLSEEGFRNTEAGFLNCNVDEFDGKFFGISAAELASTDPQQRLLLEVSWEALENAGMDTSRLYGDKVGIFTGAWTNDYKDMMAESGFKRNDLVRIYLGNSFGASACRVAHFFGTTGPSVATDAACSSSLVSVVLACDSLRQNQSRVALAGGVNLLLKPFTQNDLNAVLSVDQRCKTFDDTANGFVRAEGCAMLVLKRLSDAVRDDDKVMALIRGYGIAQEGTSSSLGTPTVSGEALAMKRALKNSKVCPLDVSFIEAHGTGTPVGDPIEILAICEAYGGQRSKPLIIGSVKTNIGHTESVSGIASMIKVIKAFETETIPANINLVTLNKKISLNSIPAQIPLEPVSWKQINHSPRVAGVSNFGITGTDAHLIMQEPPVVRTFKSFKSPSSTVLTISAKSKSTLILIAEQYKLLFLKNTDCSFNNFAYSANAGRTHFKVRTTIQAKNCLEAINKYENMIDQISEIPEEKPKVCFLFSEQGFQYSGMGINIYENSLVYKQNFDYCCWILSKHHGINISPEHGSTNESLLHQSLLNQIVAFVTSYCSAQVWKSWGVMPDIVFGHSLGEITASVCANVMTIEESLGLLVARCKLVNQLQESSMITLKLNEIETVALIQEFKELNGYLVEIAAVDSENDITVVGTKESISNFSSFCSKKNIKKGKQISSFAFNTAAVDHLIIEFESFARIINHKTPDCLYLSSIDGELKGSLNASYWAKHFRHKISFKTACDFFKNTGNTVFLEIGPDQISSLILKNLPDRSKITPTILYSMKKNEDNWAIMLNSLSKLYMSGFNIDWNNFHSSFDKHKVSVPNYPFDRKKYWFVKPEKLCNFPHVNNRCHPLLGFQIPSALNEYVFYNSIKLEQFEYLKDHKITNQIIFPGAGYLEMFLAAASEILNNEKATICLKNITFISPLLLEENICYELQTVVSSSNMKIDIYIRTNSTKEWKSHAQAFIDEHNNDDLDIQIGSEVQTLENLYGDFNLYKYFKDCGCYFGASFQSLSSITGNESFLKADLAWKDLQVLDYICHPIFLDSMMQVNYVNTKKEIVLKLPVAIDKCMVLRNPKLLPISVVCSKKGSSSTTAILNSSGNALAVLENVQFAKTVAATLHERLGISMEKLTPPMYEIEWVTGKNKPYNPKVGFLQGNFGELTEQIPNTAISIDKYHKHLEQFTTFRLYEALNNMGWNDLPQDVELPLHQIMQYLGVQKNSERVFKRYLDILCEENFLKEISKSQGTYKVQTSLPSMNVIKNNSKTELELCMDTLVLDIQFANFLLDNLQLILQGKKSAIEIMFGDSRSIGSLSNYYTEAVSCQAANKLVEWCFEFMLIKIKQEIRSSSYIRILEIGAGTGSATRLFIKALQEHKIDFTYTYTDISSSFFANAKNIFQTSHDSMNYKTLNIENDPTRQGFSPYSYDIVIGINVLHATSNIEKAISNARLLIRPLGTLLLMETFVPQRHLDLTIGHLDGYWSFSDFHIRPLHCAASSKIWKSIILKLGFSETFTHEGFGGAFGVVLAEASARNPIYNFYNPQSTIIWYVVDYKGQIADEFCAMLESVGRKVIRVVIETNCASQQNAVLPKTSYKEMKNVDANVEGIIMLCGMHEQLSVDDKSKEYFYFLQHIQKNCQKFFPKIYLLTSGAVYIGDQTTSSPSSSCLWGISRSFSSENPSFFVRNIDVDLNEAMNTESAFKYLTPELWSDDNETMVAFRNNVRYTPRLINFKSNFLPALKYPIPQDKTSLLLPTSKLIQDLKFQTLMLKPLGPKEVEIKVKASGLNFRDVLVVLKMTSQFENVDSLAGDFAGTVIKAGPEAKRYKIGSNVCGCQLFSAAMPSHVVVNEEELTEIPDTMTFSEAATFPCGFLTAFHCLQTVAKLEMGESVLIHTASGATGLICVQIALQKKCIVFATAGSKRKRLFLSNYGVNYVGSSRTLAFADLVKKITNGKGVNVVLNTLTSEGFKEATLSCCSTNARFVEISKLNIWTPQEVSSQRPDVQYYVEDLSRPDSSRLKFLFSNLTQYVKSNIIRPLPLTLFGASQIRDALNFFRSASHIGKVVCIMPDEHGVENIFNDRSTYIITGGFRGLGLAVAEWMSQNGAKFIILFGRSNPTPECVELVTRLNLLGKVVETKIVDVSSFENCRYLFNSISMKETVFPPIRGIMHAAGVLADGMIDQLKWQDFQETYNPKVHGAWNLHLLSRSLNLEHFVLFSSWAAIIGNIGQSPHAAASAYLDTLAHHRFSMGLPATSINWGLWGDVGVRAFQKAKGYISFTKEQGLNALSLVLKTHQIQAAAVDGKLDLWTALYFWTPLFFSKLEEKSTNLSKIEHKVDTNSSRCLEEFKNASNKEIKMNLVVKYLRAILASILEEETEISLSENFVDLGVDSLMQIQFKNQIQQLLGDQHNFSEYSLTEFNTIGLLSRKVFEILSGSSEQNCCWSKEIIREDSILSPKYNKGSLTPTAESELKCVFFTGATGNFGPYVLKILSNLPQITKIYCLVRQKNGEDPKEKLFSHLHSLKLFDTTNLHKINILVGDISIKKMGIPSNIYEKIASEVDTIFTCAVHPNHLESYSKSSDNRLRSVNVLGSKRIIKFATTTKGKRIYHCSTIVAKLKGKDLESWPDEDEFDNAPNFGYAISKYISDRLFHQAVDIGISCKVFRLPVICGDSKSGLQIIPNNMFILKCLTYLQLGVSPDLDVPINPLPADVCAQISVDIFFNPNAPSGIYNVYNPNAFNEKDFPLLAREIGYAVDSVPYTEFIKRLEDKGKESFSYYLHEFYTDNERYLKLLKEYSIFQDWIKLNFPKDFFASQKIQKYLPNVSSMIENPIDILLRDISFAVSSVGMSRDQEKNSVK